MPPDTIEKAPRSGAFFIARSGPAPGSPAAGRRCRRARLASRVLLIVLLVRGAAAGAADEGARVQAVIDGDSVLLADGRPVRLLGINAPELGKDGAPDEPLAAAAHKRLQALAHGQAVRLEFDAERHDRHGRTLAYLALADGQDLQERLLAEGLACAIAVPPNLLRLKRYLAAEQSARDRGLGLWGHGYFAPLPAERLEARHAGFRFVRGTVSRVGESRKYYYLDLGPRLALMVAHTDWQRYFSGRPQALLGRTLEARGWIASRDDGLRMRLQHPAMMTLDP